MADDLQGLLERVQKEGIERAQAEADRIVAAAKSQAQGIVDEAQAKAKAIVAKAEAEAQALAERGRKAIEQAGRDTIIAVQEAITNLLRQILLREVGQAMSPDFLRNALESFIKAYAASGGQRLEVLVPAAQQKELQDYFLRRLAAEAQKGVQIKADAGLAAGFRVSISDQNLQHDFSAEAVAESLAALLRPALAEIVRAAVKK
ncbi:MAG: V-type ATP synthase subunit E [Planctomycetota bacterium]|nr:V-type ATP synthase subunit E [Planctomycetota bacterium]